MPNKNFGLIGRKLEHSFSKEYFSQKFKLEKLPYSYELFELSSVKQLHDLIVSKNLCGLNVTVPFKEEVIPFLNEIETHAKQIGAINTIAINWDESKPFLKGYNTDAFGFDQMVKPFIKKHHERALIIGSGGSAKAVDYVLKQKGIDTLFVSRTEGKNKITYSDLNKYVIKFHPLIINTTPLGMFPIVEQCPDIPYGFVSQQHTLIDLIYNPKETMFLKKGKKQGAITLNGLTMLYQQAEKAWEIWTKKINYDN